MSNRAAHRYAKAVLELAIQQKQEDAVHQDMNHIADTLPVSAELQNVLKNPVLRYTDKQKFVESIFTNLNSQLTGQLFALLKNNKRIDLLSAIAIQYARLYNDYKGVVKAVVTSAIALDEQMTQKVMEKAKVLAHDKAVELKSEVDESLIGGFILRVGDVQIDTSVAGQLKKLKRELIEQ